MKDQAAVAQLPASWTPKWSLSSRDKKRLKQILALIAVIIALLWLLYQLAQYTVAMGADRPNTGHGYGNRKMTVHGAPGLLPRSFAAGAGEGKRIAHNFPPLLPGAHRPGWVPGSAGSNESVPAPSDGSYQGSSPSTTGTGGPQQGATGFNGNNSPFYGYGNYPGPGIANGGGAGGSLPGNAGNGNSGDHDGNPGGNNPRNGPGNDPDLFSNPGDPPPSGIGGDPDGYPGGNDPRNGPGNDPNVFPDLGDPPPFGNPNGPPDGPGGDPSVTPLTDPTGPGDNSPTIQTATVQVPEPGSMALFVGGLLALLIAVRRQRGRGLPLPRICLAALMGLASLAFFADPGSAETSTVYGTTASIFSPNSGAFLPANTNLTCFSMNNANCWDGQKWHHLYPSGRRRYAAATTDRVACSVIVAPSNDCWTGTAWYRLPRGQLFGVIGGFFTNTPGAFITAPLRAQPVTYNTTSGQSPLGEFASKR